MESFDCRSVIDKLNLKKNISILEQTFFKTDDQELWILEISLYHEANILSEWKIKSRVDLVENIERGWLIFKQGQNETEGEERSLAARQFGQTLLFRTIKRNFHI